MSAYIENAIRQVLIDDATVAAAVGTKVFYDMAPDSAELPYVIFFLIDDDPYRNIKENAGLTVGRYLVNNYAESLASAQEIREAIRGALENFAGTVTVGGDTLLISQVQRIETRKAPIQVEGGHDLPIRGFQQDYRITYVETIPT